MERFSISKRLALATDLAFVLLRYIVFFPALVLTTVHCESWIEQDLGHLIGTAMLILVSHFGMLAAHRAITKRRLDLQTWREEEEEPFQSLGLRR